jgi:acyl transferase domain-containing protein
MTEPITHNPSVRDEDIAVIGMACRFPGAANLDAFLRMLREGREGITHFSADELIAAGIDSALVSRSDYIRANAILPEPARFDAAFFGYTPREAELLDVQQRVFLEIAWTAIEHAGYDPLKIPGPCGVFAGSGLNTYLLNQIAANPEVVASAGGFSVMIANDKDHLATRVAYKLNLRGPALAVQTACSTSLVAVHLAVQSLIAGECDVALAGGVSLRVPQNTGYLYQEGMILSPDGHCRAFDANAAGTVGGNGAGVVLLKRAIDAMADGDTIHAIVRGSAINNDGAAKVGYTAPSLDGQAAVIAEALAVAEVSPNEIGYIEAHGTGTKLGDPIELAALQKAFRRGTNRNGFCVLGAVKSNLGHLDAAAGIAGFIKTVLTLREGVFFPTLHHRTPNPHFDWHNSPFHVATACEPWRTEAGQLRYAGVSAFGIGGTNAHVVLAQSPVSISPGTTESTSELFLVSARTESGRDQLTNQLTAYPSTESARDTAFTLATGRHSFPSRAALWGNSLTTAKAIARDHSPTARAAIFLFPGQGSQTPGMSAALYNHDAVYRTAIDKGAALLQPHLDGFDIRTLLLAAPDDATAAAALTRTSLTQPALFLVSHALANRWLALGVEPTGMIGHSIGEWVAACLAGVFPLDQALRLVALRGRLMEAQPTGAMLAVSLSETEVSQDLPAGLEIAALNSPHQTVLTGPANQIDNHAARLTQQGITAVPLRTAHAFHSASMQPAADALEKELSQLTLFPPQRRWVSNVTGDWITPAEATSPAYWARQLRATVRFGDGINTLFAEGPSCLIEVGPGRTATGLARRHSSWSDDHRTVTSLPLAHTDASLLPALGAMWCGGGAVNWAIYFQNESRRRVPLPTYPFAGDHYWITATAKPTTATAELAIRPPARWLHVPSWRRASAATPAAELSAGSWLILGGDKNWQVALRTALKGAGATVECRANPNPDSAPSARWIIDLRGLTSSVNPTAGFENLRTLSRQLAGRQTVPGSRLLVVTTGLVALAGEQTIDPAKSLLLGPARVLSREVPGCEARVIDLADQGPSSLLIDALLNEARDEANNSLVLWRNHRRWTEDVVAVPRQPANVHSVDFTGVTLITGGLGGLGETLATALATNPAAQLLLIGRTPLQPTLEVKLARLRQSGATVDYRTVDVCDEAALLALREDFFTADRPCRRIIHAAGIPASGTLLRSDTEKASRVLAPKVAGTLGLWRVFGEQLSGGLVLMSSLSARLGEFGQADYAAANAFLDAFATAYHTLERPIISLAWDAWDEVGMAARLGTSPQLAAWHESRRPRLIKPADGVAAFHAAVALGEPHVLITTHDLADREVSPLTTSSAPVASPRSSLHPRPDLMTPFVEPGDQAEQSIAGIFGELLGLETVGLDDNFFDLGGHSLLATQVIARLRQPGSKALTLAQFFEAPTIRELASFLRTQKTATNETLRPKPRTDDSAPLSFAQESLWLLDRMAGGSAHYNEFGGQRILGPLDPARFHTALLTVINRHEILRTRFVERDGSPVQIIVPANELKLDLPLLDWSTLTDAATETALAQEAAALVEVPFDLTQIPLLRGRLIRRRADEHVLFICIHHIVFDGWSSRIFFAEMLAAYAGETLPCMPVQYADFAHWQRTQLAGPVQTALADYWRGQLTPVRPSLALPTDQPRPTHQTFTGRRHPVALNPQLTARLEALARKHDASLFMTILAGYAAVLARSAAQEAIVIGSPTAGRDEQALEPLIGYFINPLPLAIDLSGDPGFGVLLERTRDTVLGAFAHQALPFARIVEAVAPPRDPSRHPLFQAMLIFQNQTTAPKAPQGFALNPWEPAVGPARSDLDLYLWQTADGLAGFFLYNIDLFFPATITRLTRRWVTFLENAVTRPDQPFSAVKIEDSFSLSGLGNRPARPPK